MRTSTPLIHWIQVVLIAVIAASGIDCAVAQDDNPSGPYIGGGYGEFDVTIEDLEGVTDAIRDLDTDDSAWKLFFGWRFNPYLALELDYIDLGTPRGNFNASGTSGDYKLELAGFAGYIIGTLPLGIFELSGKLGYYFHDITVDVDLDNVGPGNGNVLGTDSNGEALVYGIAAGVTLIEHLSVKVEYELMDIERLDDAYTLWLTGAWRF